MPMDTKATISFYGQKYTIGGCVSKQDRILQNNEKKNIKKTAIICKKILKRELT